MNIGFRFDIDRTIAQPKWDHPNFEELAEVLAVIEDFLRWTIHVLQGQTQKLSQDTHEDDEVAHIR